MKPLRVLHFPTDVGGHPTMLSEAERELGLASELAVLRRSKFRYRADRDLGAADDKWSDLWARLRFLAHAVRSYDVFHFNFGQSFLPRLGDLGWLRRLGKRVFVTFQGCDVRQQSVCAAQFSLSCCGQRSGPGTCDPADDPRKAKLAARAQRHAHGVFVLNPDLVRVVPEAEFVPYAVVRPDRITVTPPVSGRRPRILHAPTNRRVKGTDHVLAAIEALRPRFDFEFEIIEDLPHEEAMERYRDADLVIDQLRVGWYGGFAVELMAMGKPVVAYVREADLAFVPDGFRDELPIVRADPDSLTDVLAGLLAAPGRLQAIGARSRAFVERWHDPRDVAARMAAAYASGGVRADAVNMTPDAITAGPR